MMIPMAAAAPTLYAVIPAGGSGTRLWPLSRAGHPKFLHPLTGSAASLLQATAARMERLSAPERMYVVTGAAHAAAVARQLPNLPEENLLIEPAPRDSCAAIGLAAAVISRRDPQAIMGSFAADHLVQDTDAFVETIRTAMVGAAEGRLMTVGIRPTHPETGYGYLECGGALTVGEIHEVTTFKEKPSADVARAYLESGRYLWNAGLFVWRVDVFLGELRRQLPELYDGLQRIASVWDTSDRDRVLGEVWPRLPKISVDHAVMEGAADAGLVATVPGDFGWTDVGDFDTLGTALAPQEADDAGNVVIGEPKEGQVLLRNTLGSVVVTQSGRLVTLVGVNDVIVVDTADVVLVCARDQAQEIKSVVEEIKQRGDDHYL